MEKENNKIRFGKIERYTRPCELSREQSNAARPPGAPVNVFSQGVEEVGIAGPIWYAGLVQRICKTPEREVFQSSAAEPTP
ncbi:MAG: hypothetical protein HY695_35540 [Deltaproteobacteria bacterium]|nr:hypothetical protein [Deltaproteobacteria bacterium]